MFVFFSRDATVCVLWQWCDFDATKVFSQHITLNIIYHGTALSGDMKAMKQNTAV